MTARLSITLAVMQNLRTLEVGGVLSNTALRKLAKLGWAEMRETKVYEAGKCSKLIRGRITTAGRGALRASEGLSHERIT